MCEEPQQHNMYTTAACDVGAVCSVYISPAQRQYMLITLQLWLLSQSVGGDVVCIFTTLTSQP